MDFLYFEKPLCDVFPKLHKVKIIDSIIKPFPSPLALQNCLQLERLDLSGTMEKNVLLDSNPLYTNMSTLVVLKMARNFLQSVKQIYFINAPMLFSLDLSDNQIETIDNEFASVYPEIIYLYLNGNGLSSFAGLEHFTFLRHLGAADIQISEVPLWLFSEEAGPSLKTLDLAENPFQCSCDIEPFREWILSDKNVRLEPGEYICASPGSLTEYSITAIDLDCGSHLSFYLSISIPFVLLLCMICYLLVRYRWHIKYKLVLLYRYCCPFPYDNIDIEMEQLQYHAYVAYNEESAFDDTWVTNDLLPNMEEGPEPLRLCIKNRDFVPGHSITDSTNDDIHQSRKTILVLSQNFVNSNWCYHEMQMAQMRFLDDNLDVLVLVLLDDIPENKITLSLRLLLCKKEYLRWPNDRAGQRLFWQRLKQEIRGPVQVDHCFYL